jgi:hypothetical protein
VEKVEVEVATSIGREGVWLCKAAAAVGSDHCRLRATKQPHAKKPPCTTAQCRFAYLECAHLGSKDTSIRRRQAADGRVGLVEGACSSKVNLRGCLSQFEHFFITQPLGKYRLGF